MLCINNITAPLKLWSVVVKGILLFEEGLV